MVRASERLRVGTNGFDEHAFRELGPQWRDGPLEEVGFQHPEIVCSQARSDRSREAKHEAGPLAQSRWRAMRAIRPLLWMGRLI